MSDPNEKSLNTIDLDALATVTGGTASTDEQISAALQSIQSSLKDLGNNQNNNNNGFFSTFLPMFLLLRSTNSGPAGFGGSCCGGANGNATIKFRWRR